jgi:hypothetical protein
LRLARQIGLGLAGFAACLRTAGAPVTFGHGAVQRLAEVIVLAQRTFVPARGAGASRVRLAASLAALAVGDVAGAVAPLAQKRDEIAKLAVRKTLQNRIAGLIGKLLLVPAQRALLFGRGRLVGLRLLGHGQTSFVLVCCRDPTRTACRGSSDAPPQAAGKKPRKRFPKVEYRFHSR